MSLPIALSPRCLLQPNCASFPIPQSVDSLKRIGWCRSIQVVVAPSRRSTVLEISECFSTATSPRCVCVKSGSSLPDIDTRQERGEVIFVIKGGGEKARSRDEEWKKVGLR